MGLLDRKNKSQQLKKLTEKDIQKKLYGHLQIERNTAHSSQSNQPFIHPERAHPPASVKNEAGVQNVAVEEQLSHQHRSSTEAFREELIVTPPTIKPKPSWQSSGPENLKSSMGKTALWQVLLTPVVKTIQGIGLAVVKTISVATVFFQKSFELILTNFHLVQKLGVFVIGAALLYLLFFGVHYLNVKREMAIQSSVGRSASSQTENPISKPEATPTVTAPVKNVREASENLSNSPDIQPKESDSLSPMSAIPSVVEEIKQEGRFVIQVATYVNSNDAQPIVQMLKENGWGAFMRSTSGAGQRTYYSVYIGRFENYEKAQDAFAKFRKSKASSAFSDAFIRTLNPKNEAR